MATNIIRSVRVRNVPAPYLGVIISVGSYLGQKTEYTRSVANKDEVISAIKVVRDRVRVWKEKYESILKELNEDKKRPDLQATTFKEWDRLYKEILDVPPDNLYEWLYYGEGTVWYHSDLPIELTKTMIVILTTTLEEYDRMLETIAEN